MNQRPICLHLHLYKNAGATLEEILRRNFGKTFAKFDGPFAEKQIHRQKLKRFLDGHPNLRAVSSHQIRFPFPWSERWFLLPILFVRHPVDRVLSLYAYERRESECGSGPAWAAQYPLPGFVERVLNSKRDSAIADFHVDYLTGPPHAGKTKSEKLKLAIKRLKSCAVVGVVDRFDESILAAEHALQPYWPELDLSYRRQNVNPDRPKDLETGIRRIRQELGGALYSELVRRNELDFELYRFAGEELDRRLGVLGEYRPQLERLRRRSEIQEEADWPEPREKDLWRIALGTVKDKIAGPRPRTFLSD